MFILFCMRIYTLSLQITTVKQHIERYVICILFIFLSFLLLLVLALACSLLLFACFLLLFRRLCLRSIFLAPHPSISTFRLTMLSIWRFFSPFRHLNLGGQTLASLHSRYPGSLKISFPSRPFRVNFTRILLPLCHPTCDCTCAYHSVNAFGMFFTYLLTVPLRVHAFYSVNIFGKFSFLSFSHHHTTSHLL